MFFVTLLAAVTAVSASPVERRTQQSVVPISHSSNFTNFRNIVNKGRQRLTAVNGASFRVGATVQASSGSITNEDVSYVAPVVIGGRTSQLIVDTGCE